MSGIAPDGKSLLIYDESEKTGIMGVKSYALADGTEKDLFFDSRYDINSVLHDPWTFRIIGVGITEDAPRYVYFDPEMMALDKGLQEAFPGKAVHAFDWDTKRQKVIVSVSGPNGPAAFYLLDRTTHTATLLAETHANLHPADLGEMKPYPYTARDGLDVPAYLTLPPGKTPKNLPVVIMPHGGPISRDALGFDYEVQFLANRGYAVLQPNFRGSSGYGKKFREAGYVEWGRKMQDDITDGVKKLIADGIADSKRVCIVGGSYGGYAALAGAAFTPDLYACAASWAGVSDLGQLFESESEDYGKSSILALGWPRFIGDTSRGSGKLDAVSPAQHADQIKIPILLMHGTDDGTVRIIQSQTMERALRRAGKKVTYIEIPNENHNRQETSTRIRWLTELEKFLKENIGN